MNAPSSTLETLTDASAFAGVSDSSARRLRVGSVGVNASAFKPCQRGRSGQTLAGHNGVVVDVLYVFAVVQQIDELFKQGHVFRTKLLGGLRQKGDFLHF